MNNLAGKEWCDAELGSEIERVVGFSPRAGQIQAIRKLVIDRKDLILVAPTGWGKSVVFQATPALAAGICLMIMPLTLLGEDQVSSILRPNLWSDLQRHPPSLRLRAVGRVCSIPPLSRRHCSTASDVENTLTVSSRIEQPKYGVN